jgi:hypothetical protein
MKCMDFDCGIGKLVFKCQSMFPQKIEMKLDWGISMNICNRRWRL